MKIIDPIKKLIEKASQANAHAEKNLAASVISDLPYEIPMIPKAGTQVKQLTIGSTYRNPIPILFDISTRTSFPITNDK